MRDIILDNATFRVDFLDNSPQNSISDDPIEAIGDSSVTVRTMDYVGVWKEMEFSLDFSNLRASDMEKEYLDEDEELHLTTDDAIVFLAAASQCAKACYLLDFVGPEYWFFHDLNHADKDSGDGSSFTVYDYMEARAMIEGAINAIEHGCDLGPILVELAKAAPAYKKRFSDDRDFVSELLGQLKFTVEVA